MINEAEFHTMLEQLKKTPSESLESDVLEFKMFDSEKSLHNSKDLAEEFSALANHQGGHLVIGIRDSSEVHAANWEDQLVGFPTVDLYTTQERLSGKLRPKQQLELAQFSFEGSNYLVICVPKHRNSLVATTSGKVCIRDGKSSRAMEPDEISNAVKALQDYDWSAEHLNVSPQDALDKNAVLAAHADFVKRRTATNSSIGDFLEAIGATTNGQLTKSGLLFLGKSSAIRDVLGNFEYRFSRKNRAGELLINDVWDDCLWHTISRAKAHFETCNDFIEIDFRKRNFRIQLLDRVAFHEAFLNALVHRDYSLDGMVTIEFQDNSLTIASPGSFYGGVQADNIFQHKPRHRNKALARTLMEYHLVDRAGMGVFRMSLNSLKYGREFPTFAEVNNSVLVTMEAEYFRPPVFVMSEDHKDVCGIPEFILLNAICEQGYIGISELENRLLKIESNPWSRIQLAVNNLPCLELCGDKTGIYVRCKPSWNSYFNVQRTYRSSRASHKYVMLYTFLKTHGSAPNSDIKALLGHGHASQTSSFLREIRFVKRTGKGRSATWALILT